MEQNQIRIENVEDLVSFIDEMDISFKEYMKVVTAYYDLPIFWFGDECKKKLIAKIRELPTDSNAMIPIFWNME